MPCPASRSSSSRSRTSVSAAGSAKSQYNTRCNPTTPTRSTASAPAMRDKIAKLPGLLDVTTDLYIKNPQITVEVDREKAAVYGVSVDQVRQELFNAFGSRQAATIYTPANDYEVIVESHAAVSSTNPNDLNKLYLKSAERHRRSAVGGDAFRAHGRALADQPPGPAALGDHLLQPGARHVARPGGRRHQQDRARVSGCPPPSPPASRAPRRCSRILCAGRAF